MTRTENYQLPQWAANDPLLRQDFNKAMENIETGLTDLWGGLIHSAELELRQRYSTMDETALTQEKNLLLNPLSGAEMAETLSGAKWDGTKKVYIGRGLDIAPTLLRGHCTKFVTGYTDDIYVDSAALYEFVSPLDGVIKAFDLRYYLFFYESRNSFTNGKLTFTAYKKSGSSYVPIYQKGEIPFEMQGTSVVQGGMPVSVEVPLEKDGSYRFSLHMDSGMGVTGRFGFTAAMNGSEDLDDSEFTIVYPPVTEGGHNRQIPISGTASYAIAIVRYRQEQESGGIAVALDRVQMTESERTEIPLAGGDGCREVLLTCAGNFSGAAALDISMACGETDDFRLLSYAVLLL